MSTSPLVGCVAGFEGPPVAWPNPVIPSDRPRPLVSGQVVFDFGGPMAGRVVGVSDQFGRLLFRTLTRPTAVRPDWN